LVIIKDENQPEFPSRGNWLKKIKHPYIHTRKYSATIREE
jgi:hypothetical protein